MKNLSIIRWHSPSTRTPIDATYVLIRQKYEDGHPLCFEGSYERGCFWYLPGGPESPVELSTITGWAYLPYSGLF